MDSIFNVPTRSGATLVESGLIGQLDASGVDLVLNTVGFGTTLPSGVTEIRHMGGVFARPPAAPSAVGNRDANFLAFRSNPVPQLDLAASIEHSQQATLNQLTIRRTCSASTTTSADTTRAELSGQASASRRPESRRA